MEEYRLHNNKWYESDELWELLYPIMFPEALWADAQNDVEDILYLLDIEGEDIDESWQLLDLCCGPGRHSTIFAEKGFSVTAVDLIDYHLAEAAKNAADHDVRIDFVKADALDYVREDFYDYIINLYTSFGYFESEEENQRMLNNICDSLKAGGFFVMEIMTKEIFARLFNEREFYDFNDGIYTVRREIIDDWEKVSNHWKIVKDCNIHEFDIVYYLYSAVELKRMLQKAGFSGIECYGTFYGDPYDQNAAQLIVVATKIG